MHVDFAPHFGLPTKMESVDFFLTLEVLKGDKALT